MIKKIVIGTVIAVVVYLMYTGAIRININKTKAKNDSLRAVKKTISVMKKGLNKVSKQIDITNGAIK